MLEEFGGEFRLQQRPVPQPGHGEVLVRVLTVRAEIAQTMELVRLGAVTPVVGATLPLEDPGQALALARSEQVFGRIILDVAVGVAQP